MATVLETQPRFYVEAEMDQPELIPSEQGHIVAFSRKCPGKTEPNDDSAIVIPVGEGGLVLAVADGVGGAPMGYKASSIAMQCLADSIQQCESSAQLRPAILNGIENANAEILDLGIGAATTLSVVEVNDGVARGYQVGDSMILIVGGRGAIRWRSTSHSPVGYAIESGMIDECDAMHHDERHVVSNLVGLRTMHIEIGPTVSLSPRDTIVIGSDGLFDNLHSDEICSLARLGQPLDRMQALIDLASQRMQRTDGQLPGKPDDLTLLLKTP